MKKAPRVKCVVIGGDYSFSSYTRRARPPPRPSNASIRHLGYSFKRGTRLCDAIWREASGRLGDGKPAVRRRIPGRSPVGGWRPGCGSARRRNSTRGAWRRSSKAARSTSSAALRWGAARGASSGVAVSVLRVQRRMAHSRRSGRCCNGPWSTVPRWSSCATLHWIHLAALRERSPSELAAGEVLNSAHRRRAAWRPTGQGRGRGSAVSAWLPTRIEDCFPSTFKRRSPMTMDTEPVAASLAPPNLIAPPAHPA